MWWWLAACAGAGTGETGGTEDTAAAPGIAVSAACEAIATPPADPPTFYEANDTLPETGEPPALPEADPADEGLDAALLDEAAAELRDLPFTWSFLVMRHGRLVFERYFHGASATDANAVHSASKSVVGLLAGVAAGEGLLDPDQPVAELLPELFAGADEAKRGITVRHLLTMTAGFAWEEDVTEYAIQEEPDWLAAIVALPLADDPGTRFNYATAQSHLLGAAIAAAAGESLCDYAHDRIFDAIGVEVERWGRDPQGWFTGGFDVTMTPRELAAFGQLVLDDGAVDGEPVVPADWVAEATEEQVGVGGRWFYGYDFWLWRPGEARMDIAWGYGGQLVYVLPDEDMVVVITTNTRAGDPEATDDYDGTDLVLDKVVGAVIAR